MIHFRMLSKRQFIERVEMVFKNKQPILNEINELFEYQPSEIDRMINILSNFKENDYNLIIKFNLCFKIQFPLDEYYPIENHSEDSLIEIIQKGEGICSTKDTRFIISLKNEKIEYVQMEPILTKYGKVISKLSKYGSFNYSL